MKLSKALKEKNKKVKLLSTLAIRIRSNNSFIIGKNPAYNVTELLDKYNTAFEDLIKFKAAIQTTNVPIYEDMVRIAELKGRLEHFENVNCMEGKTGYGEYEQEYISVIKQEGLDKMIEAIQEEIYVLQDKIDLFNATTDLVGY